MCVRVWMYTCVRVYTSGAGVAAGEETLYIRMGMKCLDIFRVVVWLSLTS